MTDVFAKVALGPLLLAQGLYTRWVTPRLPEAEGPRQGRHADASGPALSLSRIALATEAGVAISLPPFYAVTRLLREESVVRLLGTTISCASATSMRCTLPGAFSMPR
ncbi:hypothetical protein ACVWZ9_005004 [Pseudomonas chlororaphis]